VKGEFQMPGHWLLRINLWFND